MDDVIFQTETTVILFFSVCVLRKSYFIDASFSKYFFFVFVLKLISTKNYKVSDVATVVLKLYASFIKYMHNSIEK